MRRNETGTLFGDRCIIEHGMKNTHGFSRLIVEMSLCVAYRDVPRK